MSELLKQAIPALLGEKPVAVIGFFGGNYLRVLYVGEDGVLQYTTSPSILKINIELAEGDIAWAMTRARAMADKPIYDHELPKETNGSGK
jgi:hypothetical protein